MVAFQQWMNIHWAPFWFQDSCLGSALKMTERVPAMIFNSRMQIHKCYIWISGYNISGTIRAVSLTWILEEGEDGGKPRKIKN